MSETAEVVIAGGGIVGLSIAYHLARDGLRDVLVLEKEPLLATGSTGRSAGGVRTQFSSEVNVRLSLESLAAFQRMEDELGAPSGLRQVGYLFLTADPSVLAEFRENVALQNRLGVPSRVLTPAECRDVLPQLNAEDLAGGTYCAWDGYGDPGGVAAAYASAARRLGVRIETGREVTGVRTGPGGAGASRRVTGVDTAAGPVSCRVLVNAGGPYAGEIGRLAGVDVPVVPLKRMVFFSAPFPRLPDDMPMTLDFDTASYVRKDLSCLLFGRSDPNQAPGFDLTVTWDWLNHTLETLVHRLPVMEHAQVARAWAGHYEVSPDHSPILGPVPELEGFYLANGFSGHGFMHAPATGRVLAEMIRGETPCIDVSALSIRRFRGEGRRAGVGESRVV